MKQEEFCSSKQFLLHKSVASCMKTEINTHKQQLVPHIGYKLHIVIVKNE